MKRWTRFAPEVATELDAVFAADGPLANNIPDYRERGQQREMAGRVADAIRDRAVLACEAGTGTGKTFAYLVPALLYGGKVIVSTGTRTLQDQLHRRDLPVVRDALRVPVRASLLKGRANYVCRHRLEHHLAAASVFAREEQVQLERIARFARTSTSGDRGELGDVSEDAPVWNLATSTRENCLGQSCPRYDDCFVMAARREALGADVVIVNHHLFFADLALKEDGVPELLPECNTVIFDEAHQLPETATLFFGESVSSAQSFSLARDARYEILSSAKDAPELASRCERFEKSVRELRLALGSEGGRLPVAALQANAGFNAALADLRSSAEAFAEGLATLAERSEDLRRCARRAQELVAKLDRWREEREDRVRWAETSATGWQLEAAPLSIAGLFRREIEEGPPRAWIFTSATLAVGGDFSHYLQTMGIADARTGCWDSPFDYRRNALLYVPRGLPDPNRAAHTRAVVDAAYPVLRAAGGRAFLLFTTLRGMRQAHALLAERLAHDGMRFPLLVQGEGSRSELLERFRRFGNAVLVASASFWEGVDVRGEALSLVVIDKLPFAPPDDPLLAARLAAIEREGRNPFTEYQLPQAVISLKQGAGRLIRDEYDRGVLMICDPRLFSRPYGRLILESLPPMRLSRELDEALEFFAAAPTSPEGAGRPAARP